jgi:hypothetical protein
MRESGLSCVSNGLLTPLPVLPGCSFLVEPFRERYPLYGFLVVLPGVLRTSRVPILISWPGYYARGS